MTENTSESGFSQLFNEETEISKKKWSMPQKLITLFVLSYVFFYMFPFPLGLIPYAGEAARLYSKAMGSVTLSLGHDIFGFTFDKNEMTGSGDTTYDYVNLVTNFLLSAIVSVVIYILTRKQKNYSRLYSYIIVYARYYLAIYMLSYGFAKIFGSQFVTPDIQQLEKTYGNSTPMNLLWTFMGYSKTYTMFSAIGEVIGGILLFFRRTTIMGCLVTIAIMLNVVMLNFSYDVPVKLFSMHLVLIAFFIISPYLKRLIDFFVFQRTSNLHFKKMEFTRKWVKVTRIVVKSFIILGFPLFIIIGRINATNYYEGQYKGEKTYIVQYFVRKITTPDTTAAVKMNSSQPDDNIKWDRLSFSKDILTLYESTGDFNYYYYNIDTNKNKITLTDYYNSSRKSVLNCNFPSEHLMTLSGFFQADSIYADLRNKSIYDYPLMSRGFHWINEYPHNR